MDFKKALSSGIQQQLVNGNVPLDRSEPIEELEDRGSSIEAQAISALETQIRVRGRKGVRYFTVRVMEHWS